jgi:hypothetical protein
MSISSVAPSLVVKAPEPLHPKEPEPLHPKAPDPTTDKNADTRAAEPAVRAPLPPGQGQRIDQLA